MDFKWIRFLIKWILNELDQRKSELNYKNWIFCPPQRPCIENTSKKTKSKLR